MDKDAKLSVEQNGEEKSMAIVPCVNCGWEHGITNNFTIPSEHFDDVIRGTLYCGHCKAPTVFIIKGNASTFLPGKLLQHNLKMAIAPNARTMIQEALKCFYGESYVGVVAMCRSAVVEAILAKQVGDRQDNIPTLIRKAKENHLVDATDEVRAESAGLLAREALHYMGDVNEDDALFAIRAAVEFVNNVSERMPTSAMP